MKRSLICLSLAACTGSGGTGMVAYSDPTGHVHALDVSSGQDSLIDDSGSFGGLAISPDGQYVSYVGQDNQIRVATIDGTVTTLAAPAWAGLSAVWGPQDSLSFDAATADEMHSIAFMPGPDQPVRILAASELAVSPDGSQVVYHRRGADPSQLGDVVVENADGSNQRVLQAGVLDELLRFTPDGQHVLAIEEHSEGFRVVELALDGTRTDFGPGSLPVALAGGSLFSGSETIAVLADELVALDVGAGTHRHLADGASNVQVAAAAFVDADHVIYQRDEADQMPGSDEIEESTSVRFAGAAAEQTVVQLTDGTCDLSAVSPAGGFAAVVCDKPTIVAFDGTVHASTNALFALGISDDARGIVTLAADGSLGFLSTDDQLRPLATAMAAGATTLPGPFAAYAP